MYAFKRLQHLACPAHQDLFTIKMDREFLKAGGVFTDEAIDAYIALRREEDDRVRMTPHPVEFEL
ncbi:glutamine synthetase, partial [Salmonella enterica subsp. enterica serovar Kentucky]|nr:glutamine synthetase [Salmonella enterica subsp. enterica serovar Kentucky]